MTGLKKLLMWKAASGSGGGQTETLSGSLVTFETSKARPLQQCRVDFLPKQSGSGDPSPENVRPISGLDGCTVWRTGKNLFDISAQNVPPSDTASSNKTKRIFTPYTYCVGISSNNYYNPGQVGAFEKSGNGFTVTTGGAYSIGFALPLRPGVYRISCTGTNKRVNIGFYAFDGTIISDGNSIINDNSSSNNAFTVPDNCAMTVVCFVCAVANTPATYTDIQIESGTTITAYEPYTATSYPITWQSAGTVYGGYVDLVMGVLVAEWSNIASYDGETLPGVWISDRDVYASGTTPTAGAQVAYQLASHITYTLTPQQITALIGTNNIWSDAGDVTVTYTK